MMEFDLDHLLAPIDNSAPAGPNLEYDPAFTELERMATPVSERAMGDSLKAAIEPDWDKVAFAAGALFTRTKDLRIAVQIVAAWTRADGLTGWAASLGLVRGLLDQYWDSVHPQLDGDGDDDDNATARSNAVKPLGDPRSVLGYFRVAPFVQSPRLGRFSLRDLRVATGAVNAASSSDGSPPPALVDIEACCMDCPADQLPRVAATLAEAQEHATAIDAMLRERLGTAGPDLRLLAGDIEELKKFVDAQLARRFPEQHDARAAEPATAGDGGPASPPVQPSRRSIEAPGDVIRCLDEICEYYARNEPSSPLPILLRRARRLVGKSFTEVLKNLAPGGLAELQTLSGPDED